MSMYLGIVPALTVLAMSITPEAPRMESLPGLSSLSSLTTMVSVTLPRDVERVTYDVSAGIVKIPRDVISLPMLERLIASPQIGFVVWSSQDAVYLGLTSVHTRAYRWHNNRLVIGTPRTHRLRETPRASWLGVQACVEELPKFDVPELSQLWSKGCYGEGTQDDREQEHAAEEATPGLELVMLALRDNEARAWVELLKYARGDADALSPERASGFDELSVLYRRHAALHHAFSLANRDELEGALEALDRARILGRRHDVSAGAFTSQRVDRLGNGWTMRLLVGLFQRDEDVEALRVYDTYRHWTHQHPSWLKRRVARAMRREDRAREAIKLYHEVLPEVHPPRALLGELATTYVENEDAFRARGVQLWLEEESELETSAEFTVLLQRIESQGSCPPDRAWTVRCIEAVKAERGEHIDVLLAPSSQIAWGELVPTQGRVSLGEELP